MKLLFAVTLVLIVCLVCAAQGDTVSFKSGVGNPGAYDYAVSMTYQLHQSPTTNPVITSTPLYWTAPPQGAHWISPYSWDGNCDFGPYLYQISVDLPQDWSNAVLTITIASDDQCSTYINEYQITDNTMTGFRSLNTFTVSDQSAFRAGANWLEFHVWNTGYGPTGLAFAGQITYDPVPERSSLFILLPALGLLVRRIGK